MASNVLVICGCSGDHKKKTQVSKDVTLAGLKEAVQKLKFECLPQNFQLQKRIGEDNWKLFEDTDNPLNLEDTCRVKVTLVITLFY